MERRCACARQRRVMTLTLTVTRETAHSSVVGPLFATPFSFPAAHTRTHRLKRESGLVPPRRSRLRGGTRSCFHRGRGKRRLPGLRALGRAPVAAMDVLACAECCYCLSLSNARPKVAVPVCCTAVCFLATAIYAVNFIVEVAKVRPSSPPGRRGGGLDRNPHPCFDCAFSGGRRWRCTSRRRARCSGSTSSRSRAR